MAGWLSQEATQLGSRPGQADNRALLLHHCAQLAPKKASFNVDTQTPFPCPSTPNRRAALGRPHTTREICHSPVPKSLAICTFKVSSHSLLMIFGGRHNEAGFAGRKSEFKRLWPRPLSQLGLRLGRWTQSPVLLLPQHQQAASPHPAGAPFLSCRRNQ